MKLWGGRFTKETDQLVQNFNESLSFDQKFYKQDIQGSIAHVTMLAKQGIIEESDKVAIINGLNSILTDIENGHLEFTPEHEDIHSFVEAHLIERIGDAGKKLHTGRSRNDQVALDMKLYTRHEVEEINDLLKTLLNSLLKVMEENTETFMPGFTHLQKAQPITLAHHFGAYFEMFKRDRSRLDDIHKRMNLCPLGSGALAGTTYPLDREYTANLLGFDGPTLNSMDSVSDRDYLIEFLSALSTIMMHLSRFCEEICIWNSNEYRFVNIDDSYSTGSSIMPQKKNPDIAELIRGKTGRVYGALASILTTMKGIPLAYNKRPRCRETPGNGRERPVQSRRCRRTYRIFLLRGRGGSSIRPDPAQHGYGHRPAVWPRWNGAGYDGSETGPYRYRPNKSDRPKKCSVGHDIPGRGQTLPGRFPGTNNDAPAEPVHGSDAGRHRSNGCIRHPAGLCPYPRQRHRWR